LELKEINSFCPFLIYPLNNNVVFELKHVVEWEHIHLCCGSINTKCYTMWVLTGICITTRGRNINSVIGQILSMTLFH